MIDAGGTPASFMISPSNVAVVGVSSEALTTTVLPQANARCNLPGHQQQRQVPRAHHGNNAAWHANGVVECTGAIRCRHAEALGGERQHLIGEHVEVGSTAGNVDMRGLLAGFPGVSSTSALRNSSNRRMMPSAIAQDGGSLLFAHATPGALERTSRRLHRIIDHRGVCLMDETDQLAIHGITVLEAR